MLTTWKIITKFTGFSRNTLKKLVREEGFPVAIVAGRPTTTRTLIEDWITSKLSQQNRPPRYTKK
jgi:predicted DNA-binding transcriptional regulator AlpA